MSEELTELYAMKQDLIHQKISLRLQLSWLQWRHTDTYLAIHRASSYLDRADNVRTAALFAESQQDGIEQRAVLASELVEVQLLLDHVIDLIATFGDMPLS